MTPLTRLWIDHARASACAKDDQALFVAEAPDPTACPVHDQPRVVALGGIVGYEPGPHVLLCAETSDGFHQEVFVPHAHGAREIIRALRNAWPAELGGA